MKTLPEIVLSHGDKNEATAFPWWAIVVNGFSGRVQRPMVLAGVWFNREDAEAFLASHAYRYPKKAYVYAFSGGESAHTRELYELARGADHA
jgi:hypothetical protein